jgi:hypothetical protein
MLTVELKTFAAHKAELLATARGQFALVHLTKILDTFDTQNDAIAEGYRRLGNVPFLTKQILEVELPLRLDYCSSYVPPTTDTACLVPV